MIVTRTPYRISFFGGGTDYNQWYEKRGGLVVASSFARYCYLTIRELPPFFEHKTRVVYSKTEHVLDHDNIEHPSVRNSLKYTGTTVGLEIHHDGDLPAWSGVGSSSSFTVGMLLALNQLNSRIVSKRELAEQAIYVEQVLSEESVGVQDQIIASLGGIQVIELGPGAGYNTTHLLLDDDYKKHFENHIMLGFTGRTRFSSINAQLQIERIKEGLIDKEMSSIHDIAKEGLKSLKNESSMKEIGSLISESWNVKRSLTERISNSVLDKIYEEALRAGSYGGRLLGSGGGGFFMLVAPPEKHEKIKQKLSNIKVWIPFSFENEGAKVLLNGDSD